MYSPLETIAVGMGLSPSSTASAGVSFSSCSSLNQESASRESGAHFDMFPSVVCWAAFWAESCLHRGYAAAKSGVNARVVSGPRPRAPGGPLARQKDGVTRVREALAAGRHVPGAKDECVARQPTTVGQTKVRLKPNVAI